MLKLKFLKTLHKTFKQNKEINIPEHWLNNIHLLTGKNIKLQNIFEMSKICFKIYKQLIRQ